MWTWSWRSLGTGIGSERLPERVQRGCEVQKSAQGGKQRGFRVVVRSKYLPKEANKVDNNVPRRPPEGAIWVVLGPF